MNFLEERIVKDGVVKEGGVLKVDSFLNHQMDIGLIEKIAKEFKRRFGKKIREMGYDVQSIAIVDDMDGKNGTVVFRKQDI